MGALLSGLGALCGEPNLKTVRIGKLVERAFGSNTHKLNEPG